MIWNLLLILPHNLVRVWSNTSFNVIFELAELMSVEFLKLASIVFFLVYLILILGEVVELQMDVAHDLESE